MIADLRGTHSATEAASSAVPAFAERLPGEVAGLVVYVREERTLAPAATTDGYPRSADVIADVESPAWRTSEDGDLRVDVESGPEVFVPGGDGGVVRIAFGGDTVDGEGVPGGESLADDVESDPLLARDVRSLAAVTFDVVASRKRTERLRERISELETDKRRLTDFASLVSHDLRNPLSVARGHLERAESTGDPGAFEEIRAAHERIGTIIDHTLSLAREGESSAEIDRVDLAAVVEAAWRTVTTDAADVEIRTEKRIDADEGRLQQLLENLFRNSVEHGSTGSRSRTDDAVEHAGPDVSVTVGSLDDEEGFYVADDGPGIPEAEREAVFERGHTSGGSGLGLSIVAEVAEAHGWTVRIDESEVGGARFEFAFAE